MTTTIEQSFSSFRAHVHDVVTDVDADRGAKFSFDRHELQRFYCIHHGVVVPLSNRYDCPYCVQADEYLFTI